MLSARRISRPTTSPPPTEKTNHATIATISNTIHCGIP